MQQLAGDPRPSRAAKRGGVHHWFHASLVQAQLWKLTAMCLMTVHLLRFRVTANGRGAGTCSLSSSVITIPEMQQQQQLQMALKMLSLSLILHRPLQLLEAYRSIWPS